MNILGTEYTVIYSDEQNHPKLKEKYGYCDTSTKEIVVDRMDIVRDDPDGLADYMSFRRKTARHEIIHAFLHESGLSECSDYALNEELVDWIALQFPKMLQVFMGADCL